MGNGDELVSKIIKIKNCVPHFFIFLYSILYFEKIYKFKKLGLLILHNIIIF